MDDQYKHLIVHHGTSKATFTQRSSMKPPLPAIDVPGRTPFQKMDNLFRAVIAVPKEEIDRREEKWTQEHGKQRKNRRKKT